MAAHTSPISNLSFVSSSEEEEEKKSRRSRHKHKKKHRKHKRDRSPGDEHHHHHSSKRHKRKRHKHSEEVCEPESELEEIPSEPVDHAEVTRIFRQHLRRILQADSLLSDLPVEVTAEEVAAQVAVRKGEALQVSVLRADGQRIPVVVQRKEGRATVMDLRHSFQRATDLWLARKRGPDAARGLSWRYIWRTYVLVCNSVKLQDNTQSLDEAGVTDGAELRFLKKLREKRYF